jgi:hypothetical protein
VFVSEASAPALLPEPAGQVSHVLSLTHWFAPQIVAAQLMSADVAKTDWLFVVPAGQSVHSLLATY